MHQIYAVPLLSEQWVRSLLIGSNLKLSPVRARAFRARLNKALTYYVVAQIQKSFDAVAPHKRIRRLKQIEAAAKRQGGDAKLQRLINGSGSDVAAAAAKDLRRVAAFRGVRDNDLVTDLRVATAAHPNGPCRSQSYSRG